MDGGSDLPASTGVKSARDVADARLLRTVAIFFAFAVLVHNADHLRRGGDSVSTDVFWLGSAAILLEVGLVALVFMRHAAAPFAAAVGGLALAIGYLFVHFSPARGWLSDSFLSGDASPLSWAAASLETIAALALSVAGAAVVRHRRQPACFPAPAESSLPLAKTLGHPVVGALALGNAVIFVLSLAERYA